MIGLYRQQQQYLPPYLARLFAVVFLESLLWTFVPLLSLEYAEEDWEWDGMAWLDVVNSRR